MLASVAAIWAMGRGHRGDAQRFGKGTDEDLLSRTMIGWLARLGAKLGRCLRRQRREEGAMAFLVEGLAMGSIVLYRSKSGFTYPAIVTGLWGEQMGRPQQRLDLAVFDGVKKITVYVSEVPLGMPDATNDYPPDTWHALHAPYNSSAHFDTTSPVN